jgi:hypothetical protein
MDETGQPAVLQAENYVYQVFSMSGRLLTQRVGNESILEYYSPRQLNERIYFLARETVEVV